LKILIADIIYYRYLKLFLLVSQFQVSSSLLLEMIELAAWRCSGQWNSAGRVIRPSLVLWGVGPL
jgi:hypothetical protein